MLCKFNFVGYNDVGFVMKEAAALGTVIVKNKVESRF